MSIPEKTPFEVPKPSRRGFLASALFGAGVLAAPKAFAKDEAPAAAGDAPTLCPERVMLSWSGDPARTQSVTWRASRALEKPQGQIALLNASPKFDKDALTVNGFSKAFESAVGVKANQYGVTFGNLEPGSHYCYRVGDGKVWSEWNVFRTAVDKVEPFRFLYFGDAQNDIRAMCSRTFRYSFQQTNAARFALFAGDLVTEGYKDELWEEFAAAAGFMAAMIPIVPTPGNHDTHPLPGSSEPKRPYWASKAYHGHFCLPENGPKDVDPLKQEAYYLDYQGARIISVNSNVFTDDPPTEAVHKAAWDGQLAWLESVLKDNPNKWTIVTHHHPIYSVGENRDNEMLRSLVQPLYEKYHVDLVLQGHDHTYGRTHKIVKDKIVDPAAPGVVYAVSVSGPKMYHVAPKFGSLMATVTGDKQMYQSIDINGDVLTYDAYTMDGQRFDGFKLTKDGKGGSVLS